MRKTHMCLQSVTPQVNYSYQKINATTCKPVTLLPDKHPAMIDASTAYTLLAMALFIFLALIIVHQHNCADQIRRKKGEVKSVEGQLGERIKLLEEQVDNLKVKIEDVDEQLVVLEDQHQ